MLKYFVKVGKITNLSDARYCSGMTVDQLGVSIDPNDPTSVSPDLYKTLSNWVEGPEWVLELNKIPDQMLEYTADIYQTGSFEMLKTLLLEGKKVIWEMAAQDLDKYSTTEEFNRCQYIIVQINDHDQPEEIKKHFQDSELKEKLVLSFMKMPELPIDELMGEYQCKGIALQGSDEISPGLKDYDELADILESIEIED